MRDRELLLRLLRDLRRHLRGAVRALEVTIVELEASDARVDVDRERDQPID